MEINDKKLLLKMEYRHASVIFSLISSVHALVKFLAMKQFLLKFNNFDSI